jgi:glycosyltransferase involved in cell wall biosynthesis
MHVAIVSKTFVYTTAQRQLEWIVRQPGIELTLITPDVWRSDDGRMLQFVPQFTEGYTYRCLPVRFNGKYHFYWYRGLWKTLAGVKPDLVHIDEEPYNPAGAQAQRAADRLGVPSVFVAWQNLHRDYPPPFRQIEHYGYSRTSHIIAGNPGAADVVRRKGYAGPLSTFSVHGVDPEIFSPRPRQRTDDRFIVGYLGRLVLYKGTGVLIEALRGMPDRCRLRFIGSGPDEGELRRLAERAELANRVEFMPAVATTDVPRVLAELDALALPSLSQPNWTEQFGRVLVEAMSCQVPVVGSDAGLIPDVVGDSGLIVPEGNAERLRSALVELAENPRLRDELGRRGRERVIARFTQEQVARRLAAVYEDALSYWTARRAKQGGGA